MHRPASARTCFWSAALALASTSLTAHAQSDDAKASDDSSQSQVGLGTQKEEADDPQNSNAKQAETGAAVNAPEEEDPTFGHSGQFGLRSDLALGYKVLIRFDDSPPCDLPTTAGEEEKQVCGFANAPALDLALSYALFDAIEPYLWFRLGLGEPEKTFTSASRWVGAGIRIYTMSDSQLKIFFEPGAAIELEGATASAPPAANYDTDFVGHVHFGLQYDFLKNLGLYVSAGPNVSFVRAIGTDFEGAIGLQLRGP